MSRTYRKSSITEEKTLVEHTNSCAQYYIRRCFYYERYLTDAGQKAYEAAFAEWETKYYASSSRDYGCWKYYSFHIEMPRVYYFQQQRVVWKDIDLVDEAKKDADEYSKFKRDGYLSNTGRKTAFKKHCARDLRRFNRELSRKVVKNDDSWEQKPYPDTYLGKIHTWDYY